MTLAEERALILAELERIAHDRDETPQRRRVAREALRAERVGNLPTSGASHLSPPGRAAAGSHGGGDFERSNIEYQG